MPNVARDSLTATRWGALRGRWLEAFGFKEGAKFTAIDLEGGLLVLTIYEAAPGGGTSRPETSRALDAQDDALPPRNLA